MTRKEQIKQAAQKDQDEYQTPYWREFKRGAEWADVNPNSLTEEVHAVAANRFAEQLQIAVEALEKLADTSKFTKDKYTIAKEALEKLDRNVCPSQKNK